MIRTVKNASIYGEKQDEIFKKAQRIMSGEEKIEEGNEFNEDVE